VDKNLKMKMMLIKILELIRKWVRQVSSDIKLFKISSHSLNKIFRIINLQIRSSMIVVQSHLLFLLHPFLNMSSKKQKILVLSFNLSINNKKRIVLIRR
jgi:hypothetical protein